MKHIASKEVMKGILLQQVLFDFARVSINVTRNFDLWNYKHYWDHIKSVN